jgi:hypothetical protein
VKIQPKWVVMPGKQTKKQYFFGESFNSCRFVRWVSVIHDKAEIPSLEN